MGKFNSVLDSGFHFLFPVIDTIAYKHSTKELAFEITKQAAITKDNVQINIDGVVYIRVTDPERASYEIDDPFFALSTLAQTTMRSEIGKITLDTTFAERQNLNAAIVEGIEKVAQAWGISIKRYEIRDIVVPEQIRLAMDLEAEAERKKRKTILESIAEKESLENRAQGKKISVQLVSEANMVEEINMAKGEAFAVEAKAKAHAEAITKLAHAISQPGGERAVAFKVAENYIESFGNLAKRGNTIIVPANVNDPSAMVTQAITIFDKIYNAQKNEEQTLSKNQALEKMIAHLQLNKHDKEEVLKRLDSENVDQQHQ
jgi:regulator of protease activity HflC (stomatin/prohibitin superfamily)